MIRSLRAVAIVLILQACIPYSGGQFLMATPSSQTPLGEVRYLNQLAVTLNSNGKSREAFVVTERALALGEQALGPSHPELATSLNNLAELYEAQGMYAKAEPLHVRALAIRERVLGPSHLVVAMSLNNLAELYAAQDAYDKAEPLHVRALAIRERNLGPSHLEVAESLNNLAEVYRAQRAYAKAEPLHVRALAIRERALGPSHPDVATSLNNLAKVYRAQRAYAKAEALYTRALAIAEKALGPTHPSVARSLDNLAGFYKQRGEYGKAEPLLVRALAIAEKTLGPSHPDVAQILYDLARLYEAQGAYSKAEQLYVRTLAIREKALGPSHPEVAATLNCLAAHYRAQGAYGKAEPLYLRALDIFEKTFGPTHPSVAISLNNLAELYDEQGAYAKAEPLYLRALDITQKAHGSMDVDVGLMLNNLALLYQAQGAYEKAERLLIRALDIYEQKHGPSHPDVAVILNNLALPYQAQGAYDQAEPLLARAADIEEEQLRAELGRLPERRKRAVMALLAGESDRLVSLHADTMPNSAPALELAFTTLLRRKGRILDSLVDGETQLRAYLPPGLRAQLDQFGQAHAELAARLYDPVGQSAMDRAAVKALRARIDDLEAALSAASPEFRTQVESVTLAKVQAALPAGTALVEFVRYKRFDARQPRPWQEDRYIAYLLTAHGPPQWVALGEAAPIDAQINAVLAEMRRKLPTEIPQAALQRLDAMVFAPIRPRLTGVSHVIVAPDSKLNLVPFEALVDPQGRYALENYLVSYVTTGRDLLRLAVQRSPRSAATIIAAPDYGPPKSRTCDARLGSLCPLDGALAEATDLQRAFPARLLTGDQATKSALAALTGPALLHIATHGFYARGRGPSPIHPATATLAQLDPARGMSVHGVAAPLLQSPPRSEDPADFLDRAGLALAGANRGAAGIVTAREIAGFDWWGTQLVVLSACETGVGAVRSGDGVYGLRRALVLAGAASQVVSLWSVSDASTRELMRDYYGELARGTGRAEALRQAKLRLLRQPRYAHPYYWAAFIPAGDWRPLDPTVFSPRGSRP